MLNSLVARAYVAGVLMGRLYTGKASRQYLVDGEDFLLEDLELITAILRGAPEVVQAYRQGWQDGLA